MRKRLLSTMLALCVALTLLPGTALAADSAEYPVTGGNIYFDKATGSITGCDRGVRVAEIPSEIDGVAVTSISYSAFENCSLLTSVVIPNSVTSIGWRTFAGCIGLASVVIPDSVTSIDTGTFESCTSLTSVDIPDSVTSIGDNAFQSCSNLTRVNIPDSVTTIGDNAFWYCTGLTSVVIPDSVTSIGNCAFSNCTRLTSVDIPDSVTSIGDYAFSDCTRLTSVNIPDNVTEIGNGAFYCCGLTSVVIPESVGFIGVGAFSGCSGLTTISVSEANPYYASSDGGLIDQWQKAIISYPAGKQGAYRIPDGITSIGDDAFYSCGGLTSVVIPSSVASIGGSAFWGCSGLTSVSIPSGVTSISGSAFHDCDGLTSVSIPSSVTSIEFAAFQVCPNLKYVYYSGTETQWNAILIGILNDPLERAEKIFNSTGPDEPVPPAVCTITFTDQQTGKQVGTRQVQSGEAVGALPTAPTHSGYTFQGWYDASGKAVTASTKVTGDMTVYARYEKEATGPSGPSEPSGSAFTFEFEFGGLDPQTGTLSMSIVVYMNGIELLTIPLTLSLG